ncbi:hypothetical protein BC831DRAFT_223779 [Entophlyctis helioformis]|nr:hypothetical protein BC831DRAFT_223779 [Entophlyctis helioformis]
MPNRHSAASHAVHHHQPYPAASVASHLFAEHPSLNLSTATNTANSANHEQSLAVHQPADSYEHAAVHMQTGPVDQHSDQHSYHHHHRHHHEHHQQHQQPQPCLPPIHHALAALPSEPSASSCEERHGTTPSPQPSRSWLPRQCRRCLHRQARHRTAPARRRQSSSIATITTTTSRCC